MTDQRTESATQPRFPLAAHPVLVTERLRLRPFEDHDAADVQRLAGDYDVARMTALVPHPYEAGMAEEWFTNGRRDFEAGRLVNFAITLRDEGTLVGTIGLTFAPEQHRAELGYWIGKPFWGRGYATEATGILLAHGFEECGVRRIHAGALGHNSGSQRVLAKAGLVREGTLRQHHERFGEVGDVECFGILREEWAARR